MFLDSLELRYGALGGAARGGENKSSNRTCSAPNKRTPPRDRARRNELANATEALPLATIVTLCA